MLDNSKCQVQTALRRTGRRQNRRTSQDKRQPDGNVREEMGGNPMNPRQGTETLTEIYYNVVSIAILSGNPMNPRQGTETKSAHQHRPQPELVEIQ